MRQLKNFRSSGTPEGDLASKYKGKTESELMSELMKNVARAKGDGTFDVARLREFVSFVSPNLDEASRARLNELVEMIEKSE